MDAEDFIVATDSGIFHKMHEMAPDKNLIEAPTAGQGATCRSCAHCPWMAMNGLDNVLRVLRKQDEEIHVDAATREKALIPLQRMLDFTADRQLKAAGNA